VKYLSEIVLILENAFARDAVGVTGRIRVVLVTGMLRYENAVTDGTFPFFFLLLAFGAHVLVGGAVVDVLLVATRGVEETLARLTVRHLG
jgi:hypothetical protein